RLTEAGGFMPYHDKSDPEEIKLAFNLSKKNFKKAIGGLYRDKQIQLLNNGIQLNRERS
ncbi:MAG: RNA-binding protein, partial [SAR324 cluster bacterium]|nr:RNA-binding protein [SAR324 cluster bacterium]